LPSNVALAVHPKESYVTVELDGGERLVLAAPRVKAILGDEAHTIVSERTGAEWVGTEYEPPFHYATPEGGPAFRVVAGDFVTMDSGSGMVHLAPAFGEDDFAV